MIENNPINVASAFELLLEEIEAEIEFTNRIGAQAFESRDYRRAEEALKHAERLNSFRDKVVDLRKEWETLSIAAEQAEDDETRQARQNSNPLRQGLSTPRHAYYEPILQALVEFGGSAPMRQVLDRVYELMQNVLKDGDLQPLRSTPGRPRWRNAVRWARYSMVKEKLLKSDSPRGIWEISEAGRVWLNNRKH